MGLQEIDVTGTSPADTAAVWRLLDDSATWPTWTPIAEHREERAAADGVTEIRTFKTGRVTVREEIVERRPEQRLSYVLLAGLAVRDYRADIDLTPSAAGGTDIRWHTTFTSKIPGLGFVYRRALDKATRQFVEGLAEHAAR